MITNNRDIFGKVAVLMGGTSAEREISLMTGNAILDSLQRLGIPAVSIDRDHTIISQLQAANIDRAFIALHGLEGEDGVIQAILEGLAIPYTGSKVAACALTLDKLRTKWLWQGLGLSTPRSIQLYPDTNFSKVVETLGLPLFVKPSRDGSSLGITKVEHAADLEAAYHHARQYDSEVLVEQFINGPEYTVSILGTEVLPSIRIQVAPEFKYYDYQAKYFVDSTQYFCPSGLTTEQEQDIAALSLRAFQACGCSGWGRVDLMQDSHGKFYLLEINTVPGMTDHSLFPKAAKVKGLNFDEVVLTILRQTLANE